MKAISVLVLLATLAFYPSLAAAQLQPPLRRIDQVTIHVKVIDPSGRAAPQGILVELRNKTGAEITRVMTDSRGVVDFAGLAPEPYMVAIRQAGYKEVPTTVDMTYSPTQTVYIDLVPTAASAKNLPPGGPADSVTANLPASEEGKKALEQGKTALFEKQDPAASLTFFQQLNHSDPDYANGWVLTGTALLKLNKFDPAEKAFRKAIQKAPDAYSANFGLGMTLNQLGRFDDALKPLQKALTVHPDSVEALYEIARSNLGLNHWQDAEPLATKAISLAPNFAPAHVAMGNIYLRKRDAQSALKEFETYLSLDPNGPLAPQTRELANKIKAALQGN